MGLSEADAVAPHSSQMAIHGTMLFQFNPKDVKLPLLSYFPNIRFQRKEKAIHLFAAEQPTAWNFRDEKLVV